MSMNDPIRAAPPAPKPKLRRGWRGVALDLGIAVLVFAAITAWQGRMLVSSGAQAPDFVAQRLDGETQRLSDLRGRKVLLYLWAPWCGVCKAMASNVASIAKGANEEELVVLPVALAYADRADVERVAREHGIAEPLLGSESIEDDYKVNAYPTIYVIDEEGRISRAAVGYTTWLGLKLRLLF